jgi:predicted amidohydrolase
VTACAIQVGPLSENKEKNITKCLDLIEVGCKKAEVDYVLLPELSTTFFFAIGSHDKKFFDLAETVDGPTIQKFEKAAKEYGTNIILPFFERGRVKGQYYNSAAVISSDGTIVEGRLPDGSKVITARKNYVSEYLWDSGNNNEKFFFSPGAGHPVFQTRFTKIGILICYERWFTEAWRVLALGGAEIVFNPNASSGHVQDMFIPLIRSSSAQNCVFAVACNKAGPERIHREKARYYGSSCITDPAGNILALAPRYKENQIISANLDLRKVEEQRRSLFVFRDRRPELYGPILMRS